MNNKILITGAAGFIGSHLVELLLKEVSVNRLRLFIAEGESLKNLPQKNFDIITGDIRDKKKVEEAMEDVEVVYHLAAKTIDGAFYYPDFEYQEVNVGGTQNLLNCCRDKKIKKFIFFSSIAVYGLPAWVGDISNWDESQPKNPVEVYGRSKLMAEKEVINANKEFGLPYAIIRPTNVYGPRDKRNLVDLYRAISKHQFLFIGDGSNKMDYVFVKDIVMASRLAELSPRKTGDYIIGSGEELCLNDVVGDVSKSINTWVFPYHIQRNLGLALSYIVSGVSKFLRIQSPLFPARVKVMTTNCYYNISKAKRDLGYNPKYSFEEGTKITGKWLLENKSL